MNIYGLVDTDKILSKTQIESVFSSVLINLYSQSQACYSEDTFKLIVETIKEEAAEDEEVLNRAQWQLVNKDVDHVMKELVADGIFKIEWG